MIHIILSKLEVCVDIVFKLLDYSVSASLRQLDLGRNLAVVTMLFKIIVYCCHCNIHLKAKGTKKSKKLTIK